MGIDSISITIKSVEKTHNISLTASIGVASSRETSDQEAGFSVLAEADQASLKFNNAYQAWKASEQTRKLLLSGKELSQILVYPTKLLRIKQLSID